MTVTIMRGVWPALLSERDATELPGKFAIESETNEVLQRLEPKYRENAHGIQSPLL